MSPLLATSQNLFCRTSPEHYLVGVGLFVRLFVCLKNTFSLLFVNKQEIFSGSKYGGRWGERSMGRGGNQEHGEQEIFSPSVETRQRRWGGHQHASFNRAEDVLFYLQ